MKLSFVIPAHNEAEVISHTIKSLQACSDSVDNNIFVIADNCTDNTTEIAQESGVQTLIRKDPIRQGKGHTLEFAFKTLSTGKFTHFLVIDADTQVEPNLLIEIRYSFEAGADAVVNLRYVNSGGIAVPVGNMVGVASGVKAVGDAVILLEKSSLTSPSKNETHDEKEKSTEDRLIEIEELKSKGLINEDEYIKKRKEILDEL